MTIAKILIIVLNCILVLCSFILIYKPKQENKKVSVIFTKEYLMHNDLNLSFITINNEIDCIIFDRGISCNWEKFNKQKITIQE